MSNTRTHYLRPDAEDAGNENATACGALPLDEPSSALERVDCVDCLRLLAGAADTQHPDPHQWVLIADDDPKETELCIACGAQRDKDGPLAERGQITGGWAVRDCSGAQRIAAFDASRFAQHPDPVREAARAVLKAAEYDDLIGHWRFEGKTLSDPDGVADDALTALHDALADPPLGRVEREARVEQEAFPYDTDPPDLIGPNFRSGIRSVLLSLDSGNSTLKQAETEAFGMITALVFSARVEQVCPDCGLTQGRQSGYPCPTCGGRGARVEQVGGDERYSDLDVTRIIAYALRLGWNEGRKGEAIDHILARQNEVIDGALRPAKPSLEGGERDG